MQNKCYIFIISLFCLLCLTACGKKSVLTLDLSEDSEYTATNASVDRKQNTTEVQQEEFDAFDELNSLVLAQNLRCYGKEYWTPLPDYGPYSPMMVVRWFGVMDIDNDDEEESIVIANKIWDTAEHETLVYVFDSEDRTYSEWKTDGGPGEAILLQDKRTKQIYLHVIYTSVSQTFDSYYIWGENGWEYTYGLVYDYDVVKEENVLTDEEFAKMEFVKVEEETEDCLPDYGRVESPTSAERTAEAIAGYYNSMLPPDQVLQTSNGNEYYVVVDGCVNGMYLYQKNPDMQIASEYSFADGIKSEHVFSTLFIIRPEGNGSYITVAAFGDLNTVNTQAPQDMVVTNAEAIRYEDGLVITDKTGESLWVYEDDVLKSVRYLSHTNPVLEELQEKVWYMYSYGTFYKYEFRPDMTGTEILYDDQGGQFVESRRMEFIYTYEFSEYSQSEELYINYGQDGILMSLQENGEFVTNMGSDERMVGFDIDPSYEEVKARFGMVTEETQASDVEPVQGDVGASPSQEQYSPEEIYNAVIKYCYATNPGITDAEANGYSVGFSDQGYVGDEYLVTFYSYTNARVHYYVNVNTGAVRTTEFVPGVMLEETPGSECFNIADYI